MNMPKRKRLKRKITEIDIEKILGFEFIPERKRGESKKAFVSRVIAIKGWREFKVKKTK